MRDRHLRQTCTSLYHQHSRCHSPPCKMRMSSVSSSSKRSGRYRRNTWMSESSLRTSMNVTLRLLTVGYGRLWAINIEESAPVTPGSTARYGLANSCGKIKAMDRRQNMRHGWGVLTVLELRMEVNWPSGQRLRCLDYSVRSRSAQPAYVHLGPNGAVFSFCPPHPMAFPLSFSPLPGATAYSTQLVPRFSPTPHRYLPRLCDSYSTDRHPTSTNSVFAACRSSRLHRHL